jgi:phospholipid/cholesterol/gamma-HCH transport system substrate-binding protein
MKPFAERNRVIIGILGVVVTAGVVAAALQFDKLPFLNSSTQYSAYFTEAGGLREGAAVQVSGLRVGDVASIELDGPRVLVKFRVDKKVRLGDRSEAAVKTKTVLGAKFLGIISRGDEPLTGAIPVERTTPAYELPDALGDLATTVDDLNTNQLSDSLATLAETLERTPPDLKVAVEGVARFSDTLNKRDAELRALLANANKATTVLAARADQVVSLIKNSNALLAQLQTQSSALDGIANNISALATQLSGFIDENRATLRPALDKLNGVLAIVDGRKERVQKALNLAARYVMQIGEALASGPFIKSYITNLLPGQFVQPFVDAAFSDLGLDPNVLPPSELTDAQTGQPGTPAMPVPFPRTGQGGEPHLTLPDAITGKPGDPRYPYREPLPAPPPGGPPPGPPAVATAPRASRRRRTDPLAARQTRARPSITDLGAGTVNRALRTGVAVALVLLLAGGIVVVARSLWNAVSKTHMVAYFDNSNGIFPGDEVQILGVPVGAIDSIEPQPERARISFWVDDKYKVPADAKAVILAPQLVTARAIQLTPVYTAGAVMADGGVIPQDRTAVPVEWDQLRVQLEKLTQMLQPTKPGGVSTLGALINTGADNLRGQGTSIRDTVIKMSQAFSVLGDHSNDLFSSVKNLSTLVSALQSSSDLADSARDRGQRSWGIRDSGATARRIDAAGEFTGPGGRRRHGHGHQDRTPGLACAHHDDGQRRCGLTGQRRRHRRPDQPVGLFACRAGRAGWCPVRRTPARRFAHPAGIGRRLPEHRADACGAVTLAQRGRVGPGPRHHQSVEHGLRRARGRPAQRDRPARRAHGPPQYADRGHHRGQREPEWPDRSVRRQ